MICINSETKINLIIQENEKLKQESALLKEIIDHLHEGVYVINDQGEIILYNHEVERTEGMKREEVLGKTENEVYAGNQNYDFQEVITNNILKNKKPLIDQYIRLNLPNGRKSDIIVNSYPFMYKNQLSHIYTIGRDVNTIGEFIGKTLEIKKRLASVQTSKQRDVGANYFLDDIIGNSQQIRESVSLARKVAAQDVPVLIYGETGTGKELFAQGIHNASGYAKGPFVPVNCAAIPETLLESLLFGTVKGAFTGAVNAPGLFEQAEDGTIFLDEINSMPAWLQAKLLRVLQDKVVRRIGTDSQHPVNCRIISATNIDPFNAMKEKAIRPDVFFRLATVTLYVPALRERKGDIGTLSVFFLKKYTEKYGLFIKDISPGLIKLFEKYDWPGNVREMQNIFESSISLINPEEIEFNEKHLPVYFRNRLLQFKEECFSTMKVNCGSLSYLLKEFEKKVLEEKLRETGGNITKAAEDLGIFRQALHYRIRKFGLKAFDDDN